MKKVLLCVVFEVATALTPYRRHYLSLISQNDAYVDTMLDRYYTAGHSLLYASSEGDYGFLNKLGFLDGQTSFSLAISQELYAPKAKFDLLPPFDDHPYAGFLSIVFAIHHRSDDMLESLGLKIGVSGKFAFGEGTQNGIHALIGVGLVRGWDTQIGNEIVINAYYGWVYKYSIFKSTYFDLELLPSVDLAWGNANTYAKFHTFLKAGYNLASTFLPQGIVGENGGLQTGRVYQDGIGFFVFAGLGGGYVMRKMAIEGNFFGKDSYPRSITLQNWVGNLVAGVSLVSGLFSLTYKIEYTTKEFSTQDAPHMVGSVALSCSF